MTDKELDMFELYLKQSQVYAESKAELAKGKAQSYYFGYASAVEDIRNTLLNIIVTHLPDIIDYEVMNNEETHD